MKTLTFEQTFRPTSVEEDLDAQHPWDTFFREARGDIPIAIAEPVDEGADVKSGTSNAVVDAEVCAVDDPGKQQPTEISNLDESPPPRTAGKGCFYLEGFVGSVLAFSAAVIVFSLEMAGALLYCLAVGFYKLGSDDSVLPALLKAVFMLVVHVFLFVDSVCLFCSVVVSEILAFVVGLIMMILCAVHGDCKQAASDWHQYIRKITHLSRWAFRSFHSGWKPERQFPFEFGKSSSVGGISNATSPDKEDNSTLVHVSESFVIDDEANQASELGGDIVVVDVEHGSISGSNESKGKK